MDDNEKTIFAMGVWVGVLIMAIVLIIIEIYI